MKKDAKYPFNEIATCLASHLDGENDFIALENLNTYGYYTSSRQAGYILDEILKIMLLSSPISFLSEIFLSEMQA